MQCVAGKERFLVLDGMRGVAAIAVMLYHFTMGTRHPLFQNGYIAVDIFFILSAFVLTQAYGKRLLTTMGFREFLKKRIVRLYPLFFLGLVLGSLVFAATSATGHSDYSATGQIKAFLSNLFMIPDFNRGHIYSHDGMVTGVIFPANNPLWSLFFEMVAGSAFVWLVKTPMRGLLALMGLCFAAIVLEGLFLSHLQHQPGLTVGLGWGGTANLAGGVPRVFYAFACGILLHRLSAKFATAVPFAKRLPAPVLYGLLALVLFIPLQAGGLYYLAMACAVAPLLIMLGVHAAPGRIVSQKASELLGWISYPIYCLHYPVGNFVQWIQERYALGEQEGIYVLAASCGLTLLLSALAGLYYENQGKTLVQRLLTRLEGLTAVTARAQPLQPVQ